jgi:hypothetical protein
LMNHEAEFKTASSMIKKKDKEQIESEAYMQFYLDALLECYCTPEGFSDQAVEKFKAMIADELKDTRFFALVYEELSKFSELQSKERLSKEKLTEYLSLKNDKGIKKAWFDNNFDFGFALCIDIFAGYLIVHENRFVINPFSCMIREIKLHLDYSEFEYSIQMALLYTEILEDWFPEIKDLYGIKALFDLDIPKID